MGAVRVLAAADARRRWWAIPILVLLVGLVGMVTLTTAAGARRSSTALQRFTDYSRTADVEIDATNPTPQQLARFRALPEVKDVALVHAFALIPDGQPNLQLAAAADSRIGADVDRALLIEGRHARPTAVDEVAIGESLAAQLHLHIGDSLTAQSLTPDQAVKAFQQEDFGAPAGPHVRLRVVGIDRRPLDLGDRAATGGVVIMTPAFDRKYQGEIALWDSVLRVRTKRPSTDTAHVLEVAHEYFTVDAFFSVNDVALEGHGAADAISVITSALWLFALIAAVAGAVALTIVLTRDIGQLTVDADTWRSLGLTRFDRTAVAMSRAVVIAVCGGVLAVIGAVACSPLLPVGLARRADPQIGVHFDWTVLGVGLLAIIVFVLAVSGAAGWRATRAANEVASAGPAADLAASAALPPTVAEGLRMALQPRRGRAAVPVRSAFAGVALGTLGITALLVFTASLDHLATTPRLYGWSFDFKIPQAVEGETPCPTTSGGIERDPGVDDIASVCYVNATIDGRNVVTWAATPVRGSLGAEILSGRAPAGPDEVALGARTMRALHTQLGGTVHAQGHAGGQRNYHVVGVAVFPRVKGEDLQPLAEGAFVTRSGLTPLIDPNNTTLFVVGTFARGADHDAVIARLDRLDTVIPPNHDGVVGVELGAIAATPPPEVDRLQHIDWFPPTLAALLAALALIAVAHTMLTSVRRRRRDLAILKTLGFKRSQVRATIAWQATTIAVAGVVIGMPIGVLTGRFAWGRVAQGLGIEHVVVIPAPALMLLAALALATVNGVAFLPACTAARLRPAVALAAE